MIYDRFSNLKAYVGISKNLDTAIDYLCTHDIYSLPLGKTEVDGKNVFINVMEASAAPAEEKSFEVHRLYADIQIDLEGTEIIEIGEQNAMEVPDFNPDTDFGTARCDTLVSCTMGKGNFIVCLPMEPHKPGIAAGEDLSLKKCVVKVRI